VGFLYATVDLLTPDGRLRWVPAGVIGLSLSFLVLGLLGTQWGSKVSGLTMLVAGLPGEISWLPEGETIFNPNVIGGALLWVLPFSLGLFWMAVRASICVKMVERKWSLAAAEGLVAFLSLGLLILTQARGAWLGLGVCLLALLIAAGGHMRRIGVALLLVAVFTLILVGPMGLDQAIGVDRGGSRILSTVSMEQRFEIWSRAQYAIADFPFTGCGVDVFQHMMPVMYPLFRASSDAFIPHAHNEFLQVALDLGLPGLVAWGALYSIAFWMLWQAYRRSSNDLNRVLSLGGGGALAGHLAYAMTDSAVLDAKPNIVFWVIVGLIVVLHQAVGQEEVT
jgi:putative inorganic carbon (HCO3(-)) transporter